MSLMPVSFHPSRAVGVAITAAVFLGACGHDTAMSGMDMPEIKIPAGADYTVADVSFMQGMIPHHAQALTMAAMAPTHGASDRVKLLCKKVNISQRDEIKLMQTWLKDRAQSAPLADDPHPMQMPGMLTAAQIEELDAAKDTTFDRLFLTFMIQHHQGAITMVNTLFASPGGGQQSDLFAYANGVSADQAGEIDLMRQMMSSSPNTVSR